MLMPGGKFVLELVLECTVNYRRDAGIEQGVSEVDQVLGLNGFSSSAVYGYFHDVTKVTNVWPIDLFRDFSTNSLYQPCAQKARFGSAD